MADHKIDAFLWFGTSGERLPSPQITGETSDQAAQALSNNTAIELTQYRFSYSMDSSWAEEAKASGSGTFHSRPNFDELVIDKHFDTASPKLFEALCSASIFDQVTLIHRRAGGTRSFSGLTFLTMTLEHVLVKSLDWTAGESGTLMENAKLQFYKITVKYIPQKSAGTKDASKAITATGELDWPPKIRPEGSSGGGATSGDLEDMDGRRLEDFAEKLSEVINRRGLVK